MGWSGIAEKRWTGNPWQRFGVSARAGWLIAGGYGVGAVLIASCGIWRRTAGGWHGPLPFRPIDGLVLVLSLLFTTGCAGKAARCAAGRRRFGWLALVTALLSWALGELIRAVYDVRPELDHAIHPAAADVVPMLYPVGVVVSLLLLSDRSRHNRWRLVLDGLIVATSLFVVSWVFVLDKLMREGSSSGLATVTHISCDVIVMTTAILTLSRGGPANALSLTLLAGGITTIGVADIAMVFQTGFGTDHEGSLVDLARVASLGMMALAALASVNESPTAAREGKTSRTRLWLPYLPLLLAAAVGFGRAVSQMRHGPLLAALGILVIGVLARQFVVLIENQGLLSKVAREASRDSLTGLANRAHFLDQLEQAVARRDAVPIAVMCLDLDNFKAVNDALGHPAGDELLIRVAGRLTDALRDTGTVARLGGDEFAVLIAASVEESQAAAHRVLDAFRAEILIDGVPLVVRPSIGFTMATAESGCTVDELLRYADLAMYAAKREGGQCIRSFVPDAPLPYALPELTDSTSARAVLAPVGRRAPDPPETATPTTDQFHDWLQGITWPPMGIRIALGVLTLGVVAFTASDIIDPDSGRTAFMAKGLYPALNLLAAGLIAVRAYRVAAERSAWALIAAAMACSALGDVIYAAWVPDGQSPSVADPAYLAFYPLAYAGILLLMGARLKRVPIPIRLDFAACALTVAALAAWLMAGPIHTAAMRAPATVLVGLLYPWGDLVLLALAAGMMPVRDWRNEYRWLLLVAGFVLFAVADTKYLFETSAESYRVGTLLDAFWPVSSLLVAMASWAPSSSTVATPKRGLSPYFKPVACTVVALAVAILGHESRLAVALAALSLIAIAGRFAVTFRDVSVLAESHKKAMTDQLTALPNRRSLATALTAVSADSPAPLPGPGSTIGTSSRRALLLLDLYEFQEINDSIGHHFGDELLCHIAGRLSNNLRRGDLLARVGDSQFAVLADGADLIAARALAGRLHEAFNQPFALDPITVDVDARIAIALYPDHCDHPEELLNRAETSLPHAESDKSKIAVYDSAFELYRDNDPNLIEDLRLALSDGDEVTCHYQPKINAADGSVHSVEALLRWQHPSRGLMLPEEFLPAAERAGLMRKVAARTVNIALAQIQTWRERGIALTIAVNLSTTNLLDLDLVGTIEGLLRTHRLPANALIIEITESTLVDSVRSRNTVAALQRLGVRISLDDYGTGWSSLARLQDVSVDELKLDRVFVARLAQDPRSVAIVRSTVALARNLGADLVAEGVEDEMTLSAVRRYGCTITQGFVHSPPLPADDLERWIVNHAAQPVRTQQT
jgi:diguanylate cyclase (GGDEF)-like protein